jgi:hypothetical protein
MILILRILELLEKVAVLTTKACDKDRYERLKYDEIERLRKNSDAHGIPEYEYGRRKRRSEYPYGKR